jgi:hypothetical protein
MSWIFAGVVDLMYTGTPSDGSLLQIDFVQQGVDSANGRGVADGRGYKARDRGPRRCTRQYVEEPDGPQRITCPDSPSQ